jgi:hypothetical protein
MEECNREEHVFSASLYLLLVKCIRAFRNLRTLDTGVKLFLTNWRIFDRFLTEIST